jgi:hypothetical protein
MYGARISTGFGTTLIVIHDGAVGLVLYPRV